MLFSDKLIKKLKETDKICVLTGAGVSAESGVPTFRGEGGLWNNYRPEDLATPEAFNRDPDLVWEWYSYRRKLVAKVKPNPGHYALAEIESFGKQFTLITQNVDNLHQDAGSQNVLELHGNIMRSWCIRCGETVDVEMSKQNDSIPYCKCSGRLRPDVVWFGEPLPQDSLMKANNSSENCDLFLCVGTAALVHPAAGLPLIAKRQGAFVVEINKDRTPISSQVDESYQGNSGEILPLLATVMKGTL